MPWDAQSFQRKHNQGLSRYQAKGAAAQANAMLKAGVPEGEAIATANKHADKAKGDKSAGRYGKKG